MIKIQNKLYFLVFWEFIMLYYIILLYNLHQENGMLREKRDKDESIIIQSYWKFFPNWLLHRYDKYKFLAVLLAPFHFLQLVSTSQ